MLNDDSTQYKYTLDGSVVIIGRDRHCDIRVTGVGVSRQHVSISLVKDNIVLTDLKSSFGVRVNGNIQENNCVLMDGDELSIGVQSFKISVGESGFLLQCRNISDSNNTDSIDKGKECIIGRDPLSEIYLPHLMVSRLHASVKIIEGEGLQITDQRSANGTYVNGRLVASKIIEPDDIIQIGPYRLQLQNGKLIKVNDRNRVKLELCGVSVVKNGNVLLNNINCTIAAGEFVAILGPSGAGKSTLVGALTGRIPFSSGDVLANGLPLRNFLDAFSSNIGYVAQENLLFSELTVGEIFTEQCLLRLPHDSTNAERKARIGEIITLLDVADLLNQRISDLSGGEVRRVDLGIELLSSPAIIFLDEPMSGLDPGLVKRFMTLFRRICDQGHTLVLITHTLERLESCDRVIFLNKGEVVFQGPSSELQSRFDAESIADVYQKTSQKHLKRINNKDSKAVDSALTSMMPAGIRKLPSGSFSTQFFLLLRRYTLIFIRDSRNFTLTLIQPPIIALLLFLVFQNTHKFLPMSFYFCLVISSIWIGGVNSIRDIAREWLLVQRDYRAGLSLRAYVLSKIALATGISLVLSLLFFCTLKIVLNGYGFKPEIVVLLSAGTISGALLGLCISSFSRHVGRAITVLPLVLIPQIFFSGILIPFDRMSQLGELFSHLTISRPVFSLFKQVCILNMSAIGSNEWPTLLYIITVLIILTFIFVFRTIAHR